MDLRKATNLVANYANKTEQTEVFIEPLTITLIASILGALFQAARLYCEGKNQSVAEGIQEVCKNPTAKQIRRVARTVRRFGSKRLNYRQRMDLTSYIFIVGSSTSIEDFTQLLQENEQGEYGEWEV